MLSHLENISHIAVAATSLLLLQLAARGSTVGPAVCRIRRREIVRVGCCGGGSIASAGCAGAKIRRLGPGGIRLPDVELSVNRFSSLLVK
jgi:hypothetical protein